MTVTANSVIISKAPFLKTAFLGDERIRILNKDNHFYVSKTQAILVFFQSSLLHIQS